MPFLQNSLGESAPEQSTVLDFQGHPAIPCRSPPQVYRLGCQQTVLLEWHTDDEQWWHALPVTTFPINPGLNQHQSMLVL